MNVALANGPLDGNSAAHRVDHAAELRENSVAGRLHHAAVVLRNAREKQRIHESLESGKSASLVQFHEPAIADRVGDEDRSETALDAFLGHMA